MIRIITSCHLFFMTIFIVNNGKLIPSYFKNNHETRRQNISAANADTTLTTKNLCTHHNTLEVGVCKIKGYKSHMLPRRNFTIFARISHQNIHSVNDKTNTYSMDMELVLYWTDPGIESNFRYIDKLYGHIPLSSKAVEKMWTPEIFISNLSNYKSFVDSQHVASAKILYKNRYFENNDTAIEYKFAFRAPVYCSFDLSNYPNDKSLCHFVFGGQYDNIRYIFLEQHLPNDRSITDLHDCRMSLSNGSLLESKIFKNSISLEIEIHRIIRPFIYRYYLPCAGGVVVSSLSMTLPTNVVQARVALLVTVLLMVVNLYDTQMVRKQLLWYF